MNTPIHITNEEQSEAHSKDDGMPLRLLRIASKSPSRANTNPQNATDDKQTNVIHDSTAREVMVTAPPRIMHIEVTTNSARNMIPIVMASQRMVLSVVLIIC